MKITLEGQRELKEFIIDSVQDVSEMWDDATKVFLRKLQETARPHMTGRPSKLERNIYTKTLKKNGRAYGTEGGVKNEGMMVDWKGKRVNYATFVEYGTRPHPIAPKNKKALRWVGANGRFVFAKKVPRHPGYKGDPFLHKAAMDTFNDLERIFNRR